MLRSRWQWLGFFFWASAFVALPWHGLHMDIQAKTLAEAGGNITEVCSSSLTAGQKGIGFKAVFR